MKNFDKKKFISYIKRYNPQSYDYLSYLLANTPIKIVDEEKIKTASIKLSGEKSIFIGKEFFEEKIDGYNDLLTVILHEIFHQTAFSEDKNSKINHTFENFAQDMWINGQLSSIFNLGNIFNKLYKNKMPYMLLAQPPCNRKTYKVIVDYLGNKIYADDLIEFWNDVFSPYGNYTATKVKNKLSFFLNINRLNKYTPLPIIIKIEEELKTEKDYWVKEKLKSNRYGERLQTNKSSKNVKTISGVSHITKLIYSYFSTEGKIARKMLDYENIQGIIPYFSRKDIISLASESTPLFYDNIELFKTKSYKSTGLYIDVSMSMYDFINSIYSLTLKLTAFVEPPHYIFSNKVFPITFKELKNGKFLTTRGTDLNCVVEHAKENHFQNIIVITDGLFNINRSLSIWAKSNLKILFIITEPNNDKYYAPIISKRKIKRLEKISITLKKLGGKIVIWSVN